jgi:hypothetical protein
MWKCELTSRKLNRSCINFNQWQTSSRTTKLLCTMVAKNFFFNFFFLIAIPVFSHTAFYGTFRSAAFSITISFFLPFSGDATGLRGTFPGHPRPFHLTFTDIHNNIYTPMGTLPFPTGLEPVLTSRWWPKECWFFLPPPYRQPLIDIHTHPWPGGRFLPLKKSSPFGGIRTH